MEKGKRRKKRLRREMGLSLRWTKVEGLPPKALNLYGIEADSWSDESEMFDSFTKCAAELFKAQASVEIRF